MTLALDASVFVKVCVCWGFSLYCQAIASQINCSLRGSCSKNRCARYERFINIGLEQSPDMEGGQLLSIIPQLAAFECISRYDICNRELYGVQYNCIFYILNLDSTKYGKDSKHEFTYTKWHVRLRLFAQPSVRTFLDIKVHIQAIESCSTFCFNFDGSILYLQNSRWKQFVSFSPSAPRKSFHLLELPRRGTKSWTGGFRGI